MDGRELKGSAEETTTYLRSLTAADIARIEVMPLAGTEFAADTRGGAILITLRGAATAAWTATCNSPRCKATG